MAEHWSCTKFRYDVVEIGGVDNPASALYELHPIGQCVDFGASAGEVHSILDIASPDLFGPLAPDPHGSGSKRLEPFRSDLDQAPDHFFDNTLAVECFAAPGRDGQLRCLPQGL